MWKWLTWRHYSLLDLLMVLAASHAVRALGWVVGTLVFMAIWGIWVLGTKAWGK